MAVPPLSLTTVIDTDISVADVGTITSRVDAAGARRIMGMLVDMYSDPATAVVREYIANAVDATTAAGSLVPVEVTIPDELTPNLVIADRGTGMSASEVESVYLAFAASTKRDTNTQVGGLGIGAKSAWTVADSFVIETVKAGRRTVVRAARDLEHQVLVADAVTDLPQGTSITIPVGAKNMAQWRPIVESVAAAHRPGMVAVDGRPVVSVQGGPRWVGPIRCGSLGSKRGEVVVLSGGTLFAVPADLAKKVVALVGMGCVLELPVGSFDHTPSRESVIATARTEAAVEQAMAEFASRWTALEKQIGVLAGEDIQAAQELRDATLGGDGKTSQLLPIRAKFAFPNDVFKFGRAPGSSHRSWISATAADPIPVEVFRHWCTSVLIVRQVPEGRTLRGIAKYIKHFAPKTSTVVALRGAAETMELPVVYSGQSMTVGVNTPGAVVIAYTDMRQRLADLRGNQRQIHADQSYRVMTSKDGIRSDAEMPLTQIAALTDPVLYAGREWLEFPVSLDDGVLVYLNSRSAARFAAAVPHAVEVTEWIARRADQLSSSVPELDLEAIALKSSPHKVALFAVVASLIEHIPATHPAAQTLNRMNAIHRRATAPAAIPVQVRGALNQARRLQKATKVAAAARRVNDLAGTILGMYPLLGAMIAARGVSTDSNEIAHLGAYLATVAPMTETSLDTAA